MDKFIISSGKMVVSDPCYDLDVWCSATLNNVKNGTWIAEVIRESHGTWGDRNAELMVFHESIHSRKGKARWRWQDSNIGVDAGVAGFFDYNKFKDIKLNKQLDQDFDHWWMDTISNDSDKVISNDFCVISHAGFGDGVYSLHVVSENDEIVAAKIVFIDENEDNEIDEV